MEKSIVYKAKTLESNIYIYGALSILDDNIAIIHTSEAIPEIGEENVGGIDYVFSNVYVDIDTIIELKGTSLRK